MIDHMLAGPQYVLLGAEKATEATMAQRKADAPLRPTVPRKPAAGPFSDASRQLDLIEAIHNRK